MVGRRRLDCLWRYHSRTFMVICLSNEVHDFKKCFCVLKCNAFVMYYVVREHATFCCS